MTWIQSGQRSGTLHRVLPFYLSLNTKKNKETNTNTKTNSKTKTKKKTKPIDMDTIWPAERNTEQGPPFLLIVEYKDKYRDKYKDKDKYKYKDKDKAN